MGNKVSRAVGGCFTPQGEEGRFVHGMQFSESLDAGLGHSFCYVRPRPPKHVYSEKNKNVAETSFKAISGASVSANTATPRSITSQEQFNSFSNVPIECAAAFESTSSFSALPLQRVANSGPLSGPLDSRGFLSGPLERGFMSGPLERGFMSGPIERGFMSGPLEPMDRSTFSAPLTSPYPGKKRASLRQFVRSMSKPVRKAIAKTVSKTSATLVRTLVVPMKNFVMREGKEGDREDEGQSSLDSLLDLGYYSSDLETKEGANLQWAQGKAGEDRVHVVLSEEHGWLFVGIYDGFNGPDAPDFLMSNLYPAIYRGLKGLLWDYNEGFDRFTCSPISEQDSSGDRVGSGGIGRDGIQRSDEDFLAWLGQPRASRNLNPSREECNREVRPYKFLNSLNAGRYEWERERLEEEERQRENLRQEQEVREAQKSTVDHDAILNALAQALRATEDSYLEMVDRVLHENPEVALVGSCVLVMLMKDEDVYIMNVGDSRAIIAQDRRHASFSSLSRFSHVQPQTDSPMLDEQNRIGARDTLLRQELERIIEETPTELEALESSHDATSLVPPPPGSLLLSALQLSSDHSTSIPEEVERIKAEHPDDDNAISNDRVKGSLKVTRAFGAGFLKEPKWNSGLLERFRCDFVGSDPYITCSPFLHHHCLGPQDRFLVLSSDGLYQYLSNEEVVSHVEWCLEKSPDGDPAQCLIEELLFRAAKKNGMDFHELLDIPQGDRRKYHDDVSVMVISLEGRIWRSSS
ncbi:unnamed protein product [Sphagnum jensenii]|uniref:PPM-type phosphatase domain-containing protein n=1 Tax=Sphagnum jensenii TaxID=128206 RepID=A0ABP1BL42_9BRYO